jgi:hypothetical protein
MMKEQTKYRTFNTGGLCFPTKHYMVEPLKRLQEVEGLIREELYFTIHAPRQTGKTTYLHALARKLNAEGNYITVVASCERAGVASMTLEKANEVIINSIYSSAKQQLPENQRPENPGGKTYLDIKNYLEKWSEEQEKSIVLFLDEIDALLDDVLVSVLRQLRDGYQSRPGHFPSSAILVGLRDVRDYKDKVRTGIQSYGTGSPFNIKSDSLFLTNFTQQEVSELLDQHGEETGQVFPLEVKEEIFRLTAGQPWLTNALARQIVSRILKYDFSQKITLELLMKAKQQLILRREMHLESLGDRLKEDRVKRIVQAIINGERIISDILEDDIAYVRDLGIVGPTNPLQFANPIYAEVVPRVMAYPIEAVLPKEIQTPWFVNQDGTLNMGKVLKEFQEYYRRNSGAWLQRYEYRESAHHLLLMAFLQRIINAGGEIVREMALGNGRIDMLVKFGTQEFALEIKIKWDNSTIQEGKEQLARYLDTLGLSQGYLVIFDPGDIQWEKKIYWKETVHNGKTIIMIGM